MYWKIFLQRLKKLFLKNLFSIYLKMAQKISPRSLRIGRWSIPIYSFYAKKQYANLYFQNLWSNIQITKTFQQSSMYKPKKTKGRFAFYKRLLLCAYWHKQQAYSRQVYPVFFRMYPYTLQSSYCVLTPKYKKKTNKKNLQKRIYNKKSSLFTKYINILQNTK